MIESIETLEETTPNNDLVNYKDELLNPRSISKIHDQSGREELVTLAKETKHEKDDIGFSILEKEKSLEELRVLLDLNKKEKSQTAEDLTRREGNIYVKLKNALGMADERVRDLSKRIEDISLVGENLSAEVSQLKSNLEEMISRQKELPSSKELLDAYYEQVENTPLTNEEKRRLLKPEVLSELSMEEYVLLWKRLNPYFCSHVTRQGFRDHSGMMWHSSGLLDFHGGFESVLQDELLLRPPLAVRGLKHRDMESVEAWMDSWVLQAEDKNSALDRLDRSLHATLGAPAYPDMTSVHFATQIVADSHYGGEKNNEVFFIYPTDFLASQFDFAFHGDQKNFKEPQNEISWNDVFVWSSSVENPGVSINAGVVFLPRSTLVDRYTGSKYSSEILIENGVEKRVMTEDPVLIEKFKSWGDAILNDSNSDIVKEFHTYNENRNYYSREWMRDSLLSNISLGLLSLGFSNDAAETLSVEILSKLYSKNDFDAESLQDLIRKSGANWQRAKDTVTAKEYWEDFFAKNPGIKPKHVVYYDGSPTSAVYKFQQENGIGGADTSKEEGNLLGFDDRHILLGKNVSSSNSLDKWNLDPRCMRGHDELLALGKEIIERRYSNNS